VLKGSPFGCAAAKALSARGTAAASAACCGGDAGVAFASRLGSRPTGCTAADAVGLQHKSCCDRVADTLCTFKRITAAQTCILVQRSVAVCCILDELGREQLNGAANTGNITQDRNA